MSGLVLHKSSFLGDSQVQTPLRVDAEGRLKGGTAPPASGSPIGIEALSLLHKLASTPDSAEDALRLLHELQVHQVELDLQINQIGANEQELIEDLALYTGLYDFAPAGYFSVDTDGMIIMGNIAGAHQLGAERDALRGRRIDSFLAPDSRPRLAGVLDRLRSGAAREVCEVRLGSGTTVQVLAGASPGAATFLLLLIDTTDAAMPGPLR